MPTQCVFGRTALLSCAGEMPGRRKAAERKADAAIMRALIVAGADIVSRQPANTSAGCKEPSCSLSLFIKAKDSGSDTALMLSAERLKPECVSVLLAAGADTERVGDRGGTVWDIIYGGHDFYDDDSLIRRIADMLEKHSAALLAKQAKAERSLNETQKDADADFEL